MLPLRWNSWEGSADWAAPGRGDAVRRCVPLAPHGNGAPGQTHLYLINRRHPIALRHKYMLGRGGRGGGSLVKRAAQLKNFGKGKTWGQQWPTATWGSKEKPGFIPQHGPQRPFQGTGPARALGATAPQALVESRCPHTPGKLPLNPQVPLLPNLAAVATAAPYFGRSVGRSATKQKKIRKPQWQSVKNVTIELFWFWTTSRRTEKNDRMNA